MRAHEHASPSTTLPANMVHAPMSSRGRQVPLRGTCKSVSVGSDVIARRRQRAGCAESDCRRRLGLGCEWVSSVDARAAPVGRGALDRRHEALQRAHSWSGNTPTTSTDPTAASRARPSTPPERRGQGQAPGSNPMRIPADCRSSSLTTTRHRTAFQQGHRSRSTTRTPDTRRPASWRRSHGHPHVVAICWTRSMGERTADGSSIRRSAGEQNAHLRSKGGSRADSLGR
jgi:hypothetical protein